MSRRLEPRDLEAIARVRMALREDSSNSAQNNDGKWADELEGGALDEFEQEMLMRDKVQGVAIVGHALNGESGREFAVSIKQRRPTRWKWPQRISPFVWLAGSASFMLSSKE